MVIMSLASWYIILTKLWDQRRIRKAYKEVEKGFWTAGNLRDGIAKLTGKDNAFKMIAEDGIRAAQHHEGRLTDQIPLHEWITVSLYRSVDSITNRLPERSRGAGDDRFDCSVRRSVRHGVGHL